MFSTEVREPSWEIWMRLAIDGCDNYKLANDISSRISKLLDFVLSLYYYPPEKPLQLQKHLSCLG
jgi:hypothetical protein